MKSGCGGKPSLTANARPERAFKAGEIGTLVNAGLELIEQNVKVGPAELGARLQARDRVGAVRRRGVDRDVGEHGGGDALRQVKTDAKKIAIALSLRTDGVLSGPIHKLGWIVGCGSSSSYLLELTQDRREPAHTFGTFDDPDEFHAAKCTQAVLLLHIPVASTSTLVSKAVSVSSEPKGVADQGKPEAHQMCLRTEANGVMPIPAAMSTATVERSMLSQVNKVDCT